MKLIHLSDLHLGIRVNEFSMIEDQEYILTKIINIVDEEKPDGILIAGDIYDKSVPSEDAVKLWDDFVYRLSKRDTEVYIISGNHDSAVRLSGYSKLFDNSGIHISEAYDGTAKRYELNDEFGKASIYLLPFVKPSVVRSIFPEEDIRDYSGAVQCAISKMNVDTGIRNILIAHQFVTGASTCDSEEISVGGLDNVSADVFADFDYVALGHIHGRQHIKRETLRYSGTPLKYSLSEIDHIKTVTVVEMGEKGDIKVREIPLEPKRNMRMIKGTYDELSNKSYYDGTDVNDYIYAVLTDEDDVPNALYKLRTIYPNLMKLKYENSRTGKNQELPDIEAVRAVKPMDLFEEFFLLQNNVPMTDEQRNLTKELMEGIWQ